MFRLDRTLSSVQDSGTEMEMEEMDTMLFLAGATLGEQSAGFGIDNPYKVNIVA